PFPAAAGDTMHRDNLTAATRALVSGEPVIASTDPAVIRAYREQFRIPENAVALSEVQLADIAKSVGKFEERAASARTVLEKRDVEITGREVANIDRGGVLDGLGRDVAEIQGERNALQGRIDALSHDPETAGRLAAIEQDLQAPALSAARRSDLERERDLITQTLGGTEAGNARELASLQQQAEGLDALLHRRQTALNRLQAVQDRATSGSKSARASIDRERSAIEATLISHREFVGSDLRRSISRLAQEGYGVRLDRSEAQDLADLVMSRNAHSEDLRFVTDTLAARASEALDARMAEAGERFLRPETFGETPDVELFSPMPGAAPQGWRPPLPDLPQGATLADEMQHGPRLVGLDDRPDDAIAWLREAKTGQVDSAVIHPDIGPIDFVYGETRGQGGGYGIAKMAEEHADFLENIGDRLRGMKVSNEGVKPWRNGQEIVLADANGRAIIKTEWDGEKTRLLFNGFNYGGERRPPKVGPGALRVKGPLHNPGPSRRSVTI
uniref:hypothetical protein n=1 Tax=Afipia felis TaxID=1035 RepID=UPI001AECBE9D